MAVRNPTQWMAPSGTGTFAQSGQPDITTLSGALLTTLSGTLLITEPYTYKPKFDTSWSGTTKSNTSWQPNLGVGYVVSVGTETFTDNLGNFLVTNAGSNIVTTPTYTTGKNATSWSATGV